MSVRVDPKLLQAELEIVAPPTRRACDDHSFGMPTGIYAAMAVLLFGFLAILAVGLSSPGLVLPMAINVIFLSAFFAIPALFVKSAKDGPRAPRWAEFMEHGLQTESGRITGSEAVILTLMLPAFIFCWAIAIVSIRALV